MRLRATRAAAVDLSERRHDLRHGVPVPFASDEHSGYNVDLADGTAVPAGAGDLGVVVNARAIQCALSRICGLCGLSMSGVTTFVGSPGDAERNTFVFPPMHADCASYALETYPPLGVPVLGQPLVTRDWVVVETGGFELERPAQRGPDMHVLFHPNSVSDRRDVTAG
jgi:hypothetical protein